VHRLVSSLNSLQAAHPALYARDCDARGFEWLSGDDSENSVISYLRHSETETLAVAFNFTPEPRPGYRIPIHKPGQYRMIFNSDEESFGGAGAFMEQSPASDQSGNGGRGLSLVLDLPPLAAVVLATPR
jgi:1,4-alpha-glucan branching enzyme